MQNLKKITSKIASLCAICLVMCKLSAQNHFAGTNAGIGNTGTYITVVGDSALQSANAGNNISALGYKALFSNTTGAENCAIGSQALYFNTTGLLNTAVGSQSLYFNTIGTYNAAYGGNALYANTTGIQNTACGAYSLVTNTIGSYNVGAGMQSLNGNTTGSENTATGAQSLFRNTTASRNSAYGYQSLFTNTIGESNTAAGYKSLYLNVTGNNNTALGDKALYANDTSWNTAIGSNAMYNNVKGYQNAALGDSALYTNTTGYRNVAIGNRALFLNLLGYNNTAIGRNAGAAKAKYSNCLFAGTGADASLNNLSNATAIGYNAKVDSSNKVRVGNTAITSIGGQVGWTTVSDRRLKTNVADSKLGLAFIQRLHPVTYKYKDENQKGIVYTGLIAQEVDAAAKELGIENYSAVDRNGEYWGIRYGDITVPLVKAVQELSMKNEEIDELKKDNEELKARMDKMETLLSELIGKRNVDYKTTLLSDASLEQNTPNPFTRNTTIGYTLPAKTRNAQIVVADKNGKAIKTIVLNGEGKGTVHVDATVLSSGAYLYTLYVDGKMITSKQMILLK